MRLTSDGLKLYMEAIETAFDADIECSMLLTLYGASGENETQAVQAPQAN